MKHKNLSPFEPTCLPAAIGVHHICTSRPLQIAPAGRAPLRGVKAARGRKTGARDRPSLSPALPLKSHPPGLSRMPAAPFIRFPSHSRHRPGRRAGKACLSTPVRDTPQSASVRSHRSRTRRRTWQFPVKECTVGPAGHWNTARPAPCPAEVCIPVRAEWGHPLARSEKPMRRAPAGHTSAP